MTFPAGSPTPRDEECRYFHFIGADVCDNCGRPVADHIGHRVLKQSAGPFGMDDCWEDISFEEWDRRVELSKRAHAERERIRKLSDAALLSEREAAREVVEAARALTETFGLAIDYTVAEDHLRATIARFDASRAGEPG